MMPVTQFIISLDPSVEIGFCMDCQVKPAETRFVLQCAVLHHITPDDCLPPHNFQACKLIWCHYPAGTRWCAMMRRKASAWRSGLSVTR